jgi:hypothetical protein
MLGLLSEDDIIRMCKTCCTHAANPLPLMVLQEKLYFAICFWITNCQCLQLPIEPNDVDPILAYNQANIRGHMIEDEARADKELVAEMPDKFKLPSVWKVFAEAMETYLNQLRGIGYIPLKYVIRQLAQAQPTAQYETELEQSIALAPLDGLNFQ